MGAGSIPCYSFQSKERENLRRILAVKAQPCRRCIYRLGFLAWGSMRATHSNKRIANNTPERTTAVWSVVGAKALATCISDRKSLPYLHISGTSFRCFDTVWAQNQKHHIWSKRLEERNGEDGPKIEIQTGNLQKPRAPCSIQGTRTPHACTYVLT